MRTQAVENTGKDLSQWPSPHALRTTIMIRRPPLCTCMHAEGVCMLHTWNADRGERCHARLYTQGPVRDMRWRVKGSMIATIHPARQGARSVHAYAPCAAVVTFGEVRWDLSSDCTISAKRALAAVRAHAQLTDKAVEPGVCPTPFLPLLQHTARQC